ncbi:dopey domain-containing protein, partial [Aphelenchoides avenae]
MSSAHQSEATTSNAAVQQPPAQQSSKYRAYVSAVDKALKSFEATTEWADLIAALGKLGKVFHSHSKLFNDVPNPVTVAKRLSQCLHPALPSGVHLKALETYKQVFAILGRSQNLPKYLYLFAVGLFPLMDHCGIKVKNELLTIFETYLLPLGADLRPSLPGFIAAVLLGLEEGTEFYSRSFSILEQVLDKVGAETFYACLWQAALGSPAVRLPALIFVNSKWDKSIPLKDQFYMMSGGVCTDNMTLALCAIAEDSGTSLTQRNLLDFLCAALPLNSDHVMQADLVQILRRCLFVVLRRDMSLNRRLYQWLLNRSNDVAFSSLPVGGTEDAQDLDFFRHYSLPLIKMALLEFLQLDTVEIPTTNPLTGAAGGTWDSHKETKVHFTEVRVCKLLHYFLDRPELGDLVLRETLSMFLEFACRQDRTIIQELREHCEEIDPSFSADPAWEPLLGESAPSPAEQTRRLDDIRKNFNSLLNSLDAGLLWQYLEDFFKELHSTTLEPITDDDRLKLTNEERQARELREQKLREHIQLFPL